MANAITSKQGRVWIQPGGAGYPVYMLECKDVGDLSDPEGAVEFIRCFDPSGKGWRTVGQTQTVPDNATTSIDGLIYPDFDWLEKVRGTFALYIMSRESGRADSFANYARGLILANARKTGKTYSNLVMREEDTASTFSVDVEAAPPALQAKALEVAEIANAIVVPLLAVAANMDWEEASDYGAGYDEGDYVVFAGDAGAGTADVLFSSDALDNYAAGGTDPLAATEDIASIARFVVGKDTVRVLIAKLGGGTDQGKVAYSDDSGASWTVVNIGGAAAGHGALRNAGMFALDWQNIYNAGNGGYIYKSDDGGETWTAVEAAVIGVNDYYCVHFSDSKYGVAGTNSGVLAVTNDGGVTWQSKTIAGAGNIQGVVRFGRNRMLAGSAAGVLYMSFDGGDTWETIGGWEGSGTGAIVDIKFANDHQGFMAHEISNVGYVLKSIDGGRTWDRVATPANLGIDGLAVASPELAYVVGPINPTNPFIAKVRAV